MHRKRGGKQLDLSMSQAGRGGAWPRTVGFSEFCLGDIVNGDATTRAGQGNPSAATLHPVLIIGAEGREPDGEGDNGRGSFMLGRLASICKGCPSGLPAQNSILGS